MFKKLNLIAAAVLGLAVLAGAAEAARVRVRLVVRDINIVLPGVDEDGMLDSELGGPLGRGRLTYNSKNGRLVVVARANVTNEAGHSVHQDIGLLAGLTEEVDGVTVIRDNYSVSKKGRAVYNGLAKGLLIPDGILDSI